MNKMAAKVKNLKEGIAQAKANARQFGVTFYVNSVSDGIRVEREPIKHSWAGNKTLAMVEPNGRVKESSEKTAFSVVPTKQEVKYWLFKPRGDYYFERKPDGLYLYLYDAHDVHTIFSHRFADRFDIGTVGNPSRFPNVFRITNKSQEQLFPGYRASSKTAFDPNEVTLGELNGGTQFVPKFIGGRNFIVTRDGVFGRGPYGSQTFRQIRVRDVMYELELWEAPENVKKVFNYFTGNYESLIRELVATNEFRTKRIRSAGAMKKTAAAGPYTILLDLEQDIRRGYTGFDWDRWVFAMGHAKGADYIVGGAGEAIVRNLIHLSLLDRGATDMDKKRVWRILTGNIRMAVADNMIFEGLSAERSFDTWKSYMQGKRKSAASELVKIAKEIIAASRYGWMIYRDELDNRNVRIFGPSNLSPEFRQALQRGEGEEFELYDSDRVLYYRGRIVGDYSGFEPKDDFGEPNAGCTDVKLGGDWL